MTTLPEDTTPDRRASGGTESSPLPTTRIGALTVPRIGLGCMGMTMAYGRRDPEQGVATIRHALDRGVSLLDTADMYANGRNEKLVGRAIARRREDAVLATKAGILTVPGIGLPRGLSGRPEHIRARAERSLKNLGTDHIDLYYLHRVDPKVPIEESVGAMAQLVERGLVREIGLSEASAADLRRAHATHPIAALETEWSILTRDIEADALPVARELGVTVVPYSPISRGMLSGDAAAMRPGLLDFRRVLPRWSPKNREHNAGLVERIREIAEAHDATPAQIAIAWVLARGEDVVPIPGTSRPLRIDENLGALDVRLGAEDLAVLDALRAAGARYGRTGGV
ncbi:aldo/keto reductase [Brachybacterium sp. ACRRE]|uniref:aldo/keto reductase n=1 Tax=Brachybacterium sp. ACRRE TaxID=2918184 RepID=UPI00351CBDF3